MPEVYATGNGAIRARINASGAALALFSAKDRNRLIRDALVWAGEMWLAEFKPGRFTSDMTKAPFGYPRRPVGLATKKLRMAPSKSPLAILWRAIKNRDFFGWDPWSPQHIPIDLEKKWLSQNRSKYLRPRAGLDYQLMNHDIRKWAKNRTREYAGNLAEDGVMLPLVLSGYLRDTLSATSKARATSTATRARLTITIPRGNRQNKWAVRLLGMLPVWEFNAIVRWFDKGLHQGLQFQLSRRIALSDTGRSVGAAKPRPSGAGTPRAAGSAA